MLSCSKVQSMTTHVIFLDCVSDNYWSNMCDCDGEIMKGRRHRESGGWVLGGIAEPQNHTSPEVFWKMLYYQTLSS